MIGIIGAMDVEVDGIQKKIEDCKTEKISGIKFCCGKLFGKDIVVAKSGEGKVNSAMTAQTMIMRYNPDFIINSGVAGGLHSDMKVMDIAMGRLTGDACKTTVVDVLLKPGEGDAAPEPIWAYCEDCVVVPEKYGGDSSGVQVPFTIHRAGNRKKGTFDIATKKFTPNT